MRSTSHFDLANTVLVPGTTLIEASAGTGKTFAIAGLCLRLIVEHDVPVQQILVTTYTVAATSELRDRIRRRLREALAAFQSGEAEDELLKQMLARNAESFPEMCRRLDLALRNFDEAPIFSIHGFCHRMLGDKAFESGVLFDAELVPNQASLLREIADDFWRKQFYTEKSVFAAVALRKKLQPKTFSHLLAKLTNHPTIVTIPKPAQSFAAMKAELAGTFSELCECWRTEEKVVREFFAAGKNNWAKGNFTHAKPAKMAELFDQLPQGLDESASVPEVLNSLEKLTTESICESVRAGARAPSHRFFDLCSRFRALESSYELALRLEFIRWAAEELGKRKIEQNILSFDDLQMRFLNALQKPGGETLARNIRTRFRAALIDEFQDTDPVQYEIFSRIFAGKTMDADRGPDRWLFFIGDPKQAIYGFRGADIFTYMEAADRVKQEFTLGKNWRSNRGLVEAVNHLFGQHENPFVFDKIKFYPVDSAGEQDKVSLTLSGKPAIPLQLWLCNEPEPLSKTDAVPRIAATTAGEISQLLSGPARLGDRSVLPQDIAVLVATHREAAVVQNELIRLNIPSVLHTRESVFHSAESVDLLRLLQAIAEPTSEPLLRAALVLDLFGLRGEEIEKLQADEIAWEKWLLRFQEYHERWRSLGFIQMFRWLLVKERARARLLEFPDGERRLTNLLHVSELVHRAAIEERLGVASLIKWLARQINDANAGNEEDELRLERDENAVRIVTMHKSKGLEYNIVFCPFAWDSSELRSNETPVYHDDTNENRLTQDLGSDSLPDHEMAARRERLAEKLRLLYVALTRAKHRCYLVWGRFAKCKTSAPNYLFNLPFAADEKEISAQAFAAHVATLAAGKEDFIAVAPMPEPRPLVYKPQDRPAALPEARRFSGAIQRDWRIASFTSLIAHRGEETPDHDAISRHNLILGQTLAGIFAFPDGFEAGHCLHKILEEIDFQNPGGFSEIVTKALEEFGFDPGEFGNCIIDVLGKIASTPLGQETDFTLSAIPKARCLKELEFHFPIARINRHALAQHFVDHPRPDVGANWPEMLESLTFKPVQGFLKGFIDLVFEHKGKFYLVDWKSNPLGADAAAYTSSAMQTEISRHCYFLQYHIYCVALHRFLTVRLPNYDYEQHFGGIFYVFIRGVQPEHPGQGIYADRPSKKMILELDELLSDSNRENFL